MKKVNLEQLLKLKDAKATSELAQAMRGVKMMQGDKGETGIGIKKMHINKQGQLVVLFTDGIKQNLGRIVGYDGMTIKGDDGNDGVGIKNSFIEGEDLIIQLTNGKIIDVGRVVGKKGDKGENYELTEEDVIEISMHVESQLSPTLLNDIKEATKGENLIESINNSVGESRLDAKKVKGFDNLEFQLQNIKQIAELATKRGGVQVFSSNSNIGTSHVLNFIGFQVEQGNGQINITNVGGGGGGGTNDHGLLIGLADDDHPQYFNQSRIDSWFGARTTDDLGEGSTNKYMTSAQDTKLTGIESGATANSSDADLLNRDNHTGSQAISTIVGLQTALDGKVSLADLATVATSGSYNDLTDKPTIPTPLTDTDDLTEGSSNLYYTDARVSANADVVANTAKVGITPTQASDITANNAKVTYPSADASKLAGIEAGAQVNTVSPSDLTDFETTTELNARDTDNRNRANHTGTQTASTISDFDTEVSNNASVVANSAKISYTDASKVAGIENNATADQTDAEIETAYNNQVAQVSEPEKTAGTETAIRRFSPDDIKDMIEALGGGQTPLTRVAGTRSVLPEIYGATRLGDDLFIKYSTTIHRHTRFSKGGDFLPNNANSSTVSWTTLSGLCQLTALNDSDDYVYWTTTSANQIKRMHKTTKAQTTMTVSGGTFVASSGIVSDGTDLIILQNGNVTAKRFSVSGTTATFVENITLPYAPYSPTNCGNTMLKGYIYYWSTYSGGADRITKFKVSDGTYTNVEDRGMYYTRNYLMGDIRGMFCDEAYVYVVSGMHDSEDNTGTVLQIVDKPE